MLPEIAKNLDRKLWQLRVDRRTSVERCTADQQQPCLLVLDRVSLPFSPVRNRPFFAAGATESDLLSQIKQDVFVRPVRWLFGEIACVSQDLRGIDKFIQARSGRYPICAQDPRENPAIPLSTSIFGMS